jgi:hypothetical protein
MNAATVYRVLDLIPERTSRTQLGTAFADAHATTCLHPERLALLVEFLHWLSPIHPTTRDDQVRLGLFAGKPTRGGEEEEAAALELEEESVV